MGLKSTLVFWTILLCIAVWQSASVLVAIPEGAPAAEAPVAEALRRASARPREARNSFDLSEYTQNTEFFLGTPQEDAEFTFDDTGRSGPYDGDGKLIFPIDPRNMH